MYIPVILLKKPGLNFLFMKTSLKHLSVRMDFNQVSFAKYPDKQGISRALLTVNRTQEADYYDSWLSQQPLAFKNQIDLPPSTRWLPQAMQLRLLAWKVLPQSLC